MAAIGASLARSLDGHGVDYVLDNAPWIPDKTGYWADRETSRRLRQAARGFDLVHAWGYRAAWACAEAFYVRSPWVYSVFEPPKTTDPELVDRLNTARLGLVATQAARRPLDLADTLNLRHIVPGAPLPETNLERGVARGLLGLPEQGLLVFSEGPFTEEGGLPPLVGKFPTDRARLLVSGSGPLTLRASPGVTLREWLPDPAVAIGASDLVVVTGRRLGFSVLAAQAMAMGRPVLLRAGQGLEEMGEPGVHALFFERDEDLIPAVEQAIDAPIRREAIAETARQWAVSRFGFDRFASAIANAFTEAAG
jgi:hypothetical protein